MSACRVLVGFALLALGAGITASVATAFSPCSHRACSDEVAASGLSGQARGACVKQVIADCRAGLCSCTGGSPPCSCPCSVCFSTVSIPGQPPTAQCLGPCPCPIEPNLLCLPITEVRRIGFPCECPTTTTTTTLPCSVCFLTSEHLCLGPCPCGIEPNVLCLTVAELQRIGITCECPTTTTTLPGSPSGAFLDHRDTLWSPPALSGRP